MSNAKILSQRSHNVPGRIRITEYFFEVPSDWVNPSISEPLRLFARAARRLTTPADPTSEDKASTTPWLLFLQGGPGFGCRSPQHNVWCSTILDRGYQILCLDQRGTGLSTPLSASSLALRGDEEAQTNYLRNFRADSIVQDCEAIRRTLTQGLPTGKQKWSIMGQSFGGFCSITYLSFAPESLREVFVLGGLQPLVESPDEVYRATFQKVIQRNRAYYDKYPEDIDRVHKVTTFLQSRGNTTVRDNSGAGYLTARRFMQIGFHLGFHGGFDYIHDVLLRAENDLQCFGHITRPTLFKIEALLPFDEAIIYSILHEAIYMNGPGQASKWAASRVLNEVQKLFRIPEKGGENGGSNPIYFTGEMIFPWMFDDYSELKKLKEQAEMIAGMTNWSKLFDKEQLAKNIVPVYAAVYVDDMYVDFALSLETARAIKSCKIFVTNNMYHDALASKMDEVFKSLFALRDDTID